MLPSTWHNKDAALAVFREARSTATPRIIGHVCTTWVSARGLCQALLDDQPEEAAKLKGDARAKRGRSGPREIVATLKACRDELKQPAPAAR